jgi:hypothetical protein
MTTESHSPGMILATLIMLFAGIQEKRLEWKPRDGSWLGKRKPPRTGRRAVR